MTLKNLTRRKLHIAGAAFALSAGLVACGNNNDTPATINDGRYAVTIELSGVSGKQDIVVTAADGTKGTYTLQSGSILRLVPGTYTISAPTVGDKTPAPQTITVTNTAQTVKFQY